MCPKFLSMAVYSMRDRFCADKLREVYVMSERETEAESAQENEKTR